MTFDDLKRIFLSSTIFRLDGVLGLKLVPVLYAAGLFAFLIWGVEHLFATFGANFGAGLWGLLEILVFGALGILMLRALCELLLIYFKANETTADLINQARPATSLLEDVRNAIHDIADEDEDLDLDDLITPATVPAPETSGDSGPAPARPRRTARRTPAPR